MHTNYPSLDFCVLCRIIRREKATFRDIPEELEIKEGPQLDTDTIVIGNGPAGIALSAMLSGWHPYYDQANPHPNPEMHDRLRKRGDESLFTQDLSQLAEMSQSDVNTNLTPFAALYDSLARPFPNDAARRSCLKWRHIAEERVPHIVLGNTPIGGSWTGYDDEMLTVSVCNWMDLPGYSLVIDFIGDTQFGQRRPNARIFKHYLMAYCLSMGIDTNFRPFTTVTQMQKLCHPLNSKEYWELKGINTFSGESFTLKCQNVVLACGQSLPRMLEVPGELQSDSVAYDLKGLKHYIANSKQNPNPILVVGDGISAADAVLCAINRGCSVLHIIRRNERQLRNATLSQLSPSVYPEYARVFQLMVGKIKDPNYTRLTGTNVVAINSDNAILETPDGIIQQQNFRSLCICIGRRSEHPLLKGSNNFEFDNNYQSTDDDSLFAIGAMAGDHFVRYLVGGAFCVAQKLVQSAQEEKQRKTKPNHNIDEQFGQHIELRKCVRRMPRTSSATPLVQLDNIQIQPNIRINRAKSTMQLSTVVM